MYSSGWILSIFGRGCVACSDLWPWPVSSRSFNYEFAIKLLKCGTSWRPLYGTYSYGWILSILGTNNHQKKRVCRSQWPLTLTYILKIIQLWLCPFHSSYSCVAQMIHMREQCVMYHFHVNRSNIKVTRVIQIFAVGAGYPSRSPIYND